MLTPVQAHQLIEDRARLAPITGAIDLVFEHPSKQFERGGPDDR